MKKKNVGELAERAKKYLDRQIKVSVLDSKGNRKETATCRLADWSVVSISEYQNKMDVKMYARLIDISHQDRMYFPSLKSVLDEFERLDKLSHLELKVHRTTVSEED